MTKSEGKCKVDGVAVLEVAVNLLGHTTSLSAKYALSNSESGDRFGAGNRNANWSADTFEKLHALIDSMERDVCTDLFEGGATIGSVEEVVEDATDGVPGL